MAIRTQASRKSRVHDAIVCIEERPIPPPFFPSTAPPVAAARRTQPVASAQGGLAPRRLRRRARRRGVSPVRSFVLQSFIETMLPKNAERVRQGERGAFGSRCWPRSWRSNLSQWRRSGLRSASRRVRQPKRRPHGAGSCAIGIQTLPAAGASISGAAWRRE